jgi:hypothetical protein
VVVAYLNIQKVDRIKNSAAVDVVPPSLRIPPQSEKALTIHVKAFSAFVVENIGLEPITSTLPALRSSQMS